MTVKPEHREFAEAIASRDTNRANEINAAIPASERYGYTNYLAAVFAVLLDEHFAENLTRNAIVSFVNELRREYETADPPIKPFMTEGVIRASFGESHLLDEIPAEQVFTTYVLVIGKLANQGTVARTDLHEILDEAATVAAEWERE